MQQLITIILFVVVSGIRVQLCFGHRATYVHPPVPGLPPSVDGPPSTTTTAKPVPDSGGPYYLDSYLPPVMQACAYFVELLQYEPVGMTTIEPPFEGIEAEGGTTYAPPKKPPSTTAQPWWQTTTTTQPTTKKPSTVWWVPQTTTPKPASTTKPPVTTWWPTTTFPPQTTTTKKSSTVWWSKPADAPKPTTTKPSYTTKPPGTTWWPTTTFPPETTKKSSTVWWTKPSTTKPVRTTTKKSSTIWWQPPSTTKKPVSTTQWWRPPSTTKKPIETTQWWQTTHKPAHDSSMGTTLKPPSLPKPTPYHRPGYYAPMPVISKPINRVPYIATTTKKPMITSTTEREREEIILGTLNNSDNNFFDWLFQEKAKKIQPTIEYDFQRLDPLPGSLIHDILYEPYELPALRDKDNINEFLRVYDDSYGRYRPISGKKRIPPTKPYVELLMLYDLLKREAKAMNLNKYEGYSDKFMKELAETSKRSSERQLHTMFTRLLARGEIERSTIVTRIESIIKDLENPNSVTSKSLRLIPPLQFVP